MRLMPDANALSWQLVVAKFPSCFSSFSAFILFSLSPCFNKHSHAKTQTVPSAVVCGGLYMQPACRVTVVSRNTTKRCFFRVEKKPKVLGHIFTPTGAEQRCKQAVVRQNDCWGSKRVDQRGPDPTTKPLDLHVFPQFQFQPPPMPLCPFFSLFCP